MKYNKPKDSMYRGNKRFDRNQLLFIVELTLSAATDRVDAYLPTSCDLRNPTKDRGDLKAENAFLAGAIETAGMALGIPLCTTHRRCSRHHGCR